MSVYYMFSLSPRKESKVSCEGYMKVHDKRGCPKKCKDSYVFLFPKKSETASNPSSEIQDIPTRDLIISFVEEKPPVLPAELFNILTIKGDCCITNDPEIMKVVPKPTKISAPSSVPECTVQVTVKNLIPVTLNFDNQETMRKNFFYDLLKYPLQERNFAVFNEANNLLEKRTFLGGPPHNYGKSRVDIAFFHKEKFCTRSQLLAGAIMTRSQEHSFLVRAGGMEAKDVHTHMDIAQAMSESLIIGSNVAMRALMAQCVEITNIEIYIILATLSENTAYILKMHMHLELDKPNCSRIEFSVSEDGSISAVTNYVLWKLMTDQE